VAETCNFEHEHAHGTRTVCYHYGGCRCEPCVTAMSAKRRKHYRQMAYGRYDAGHLDPTGTRRRIQGLMFLGWRTEDIGEVAGMLAKDVRYVLTAKYVHKKTWERIDKAFRELIRRGPGPSVITAKRAVAKGYVSPFSWDDIDGDEKPVKTHARMLRGRKLFDEIDHLREGGESAHQIAKTFGKTAEALERASYNAGRKDLAAFFHQAAEPRQYPSRRATEYGSEHRERGAA